MKCSNCDKELNVNDNFCPNCGREVVIDKVPTQKKQNFFVKVIKKIGKGIWFVISSIGYILGIVFAFNFFCDLFSGKNKK